MKMLRNLYILLPAIILLAGCEKPTETGDVSRITYFPEFTMSGEEYLVIETGSNFTDPGVTAVEGESEIPVQVSGSVDTSTPGLYTLTYLATNSDGFSGSTQRRVRVVTYGVDLTNIAGAYQGERVGSGGGPISIVKIAPGVFEVSDILGGYYEVVVGYGASCRGNAIFTEVSEGVFEASQGYAPCFGLRCTAQSLNYNPATGAFDYLALFPDVNFGFDVTLTPID